MTRTLALSRGLSYALVVCIAAALSACSALGRTDAPSTGTEPRATPTLHTAMAPLALTTLPPREQAARGTVVQVDAAQNTHAISPLIYGLSWADETELDELRPTVNSWGGNRITRYNWEHGNATNAAHDWYYVNDTMGEGPSASDAFIERSRTAGAEVRLALPTLGWVAKDSENTTCSFPQADGTCTIADNASCRAPGAVADPNRANVPSDVSSIRRWVQHLVDEQGYRIRFFAMDNEPDIWGETHYDVHPACTTYDEILAKYLEYATMVREVAPQAELLGPVSCCWHYYWNSPAGTLDKVQHGNQDFLPWFLDQVRAHDEQRGQRTLDVLDIHYYPEKVFNNDSDPATSAHRLRSTRSLWDRSYKDESWIDQPIYLLPRMKELIAQHYPGLKLGLTEWNWGAEESSAGGLAVADVLGILGREDVYLANYWTVPKAGSPAFYAFKMYRNYDGKGGRFGDRALAASGGDPNQFSVYASLDSTTNELKLMLINKTSSELAIQLALQNIEPALDQATLYRYSEATSGTIAQEQADLGTDGSLTLPASSITLLVVPAHKAGG